MAHEANRTQGLLDGGFVSPNEAEQKTSRAPRAGSKMAERANLSRSALPVSDYVYARPSRRVAQRSIDPGAFVRPGTSLVTVVDRGTVRMTGDAPEIDFDMIPPGAQVTVHVYATNHDVRATITRRAPSADPATRTVHFEIDIPDPTRSIPVGTTGEVHIDVGTPVPATEIPLYAATVRGSKANVFVVDHDVAHTQTVPVLGEAGGSLFVGRTLPPESAVVTEGRALLEDGDHVDAKQTAEAFVGNAPIVATPGGGRGKDLGKAEAAREAR